MKVYKFIRKSWRGGTLCVVIAENEPQAKRLAEIESRGRSEWLKEAQVTVFDLSEITVIAWADF